MLLLSPDEKMRYTEANSWIEVLQLVSDVSGNCVSDADPEHSTQISEPLSIFVLNEYCP